MLVRYYCHMKCNHYIFIISHSLRGREEIFVSQMRRAAFSIPSNIAEGYARNSTGEYRQFLKIAYASGAELETQLLIAKETGLLNQKAFDQLGDLLTEVLKMLNVLIRKLSASA